MYQFKFGLEFSPESMARDQITQTNRNHSKSSCTLSHAFSGKQIRNYKVALAFSSAVFVACLSGCGGLSFNTSSITKGTTSTSTSAGLNKISCGTQSLTGAQSKQCSVYLGATATTSTTVSLASSNSALIVPASVTVQAGSSIAGFNATAAAVKKSVSITITGKSGTVSKTDIITLYPAVTSSVSLSSVSCGTLALTGPTTKACSVYLSSATTSQTVVSLSTNNSALTVPASVIVPAGATSGGFAVAAAAVTTTQSATLTATADGTSQTAQFQLTGSGGTGSVQHHVQLSWAPPSSTSSVTTAGYRVYRAASTATSYKLLNSTVDVTTSYTDGTVLSGQTYYYVVKTVDTAGVESAPSNTTSVTIP